MDACYADITFGFGSSQPRVSASVCLGRLELPTFGSANQRSVQLSYKHIVSTPGLEPGTSCLRGNCSDLLSYVPNGALCWTRTNDLFNVNEALYQLSQVSMAED